MIQHLTDDPLTRLLVNDTRLSTTVGPDLARAHRAVGRSLAAILARLIALEFYEIQHVTGPQQGVRIQPGSAPVFLALMRGGLFVAEGLWECFPGSALVPWKNEGDAFPYLPTDGRPIVIVDSVIDTGESLRPVLQAALARAGNVVIVASLVAYRPTALALEMEFPDVPIIVARLSDHQYKGRGSTDTGGRLFGTTTWPSERPD